MRHTALNSNTTVTLADQQSAAAALAALAETFGHLPGGHIGMCDSPRNYLSVSLRSPSALEAWREALKIAPAAVEFHTYNDSVWLAMDATFRGVMIHVSMHDMPISFEVASVSPAEDAARQVALAVLPSEWSASDAAVSA